MCSVTSCFLKKGTGPRTSPGRPGKSAFWTAKSALWTGKKVWEVFWMQKKAQPSPDGLTEGLSDGWPNGWTDGWTDGWTGSHSRMVPLPQMYI